MVSGRSWCAWQVATAEPVTTCSYHLQYTSVSAAFTHDCVAPPPEHKPTKASLAAHACSQQQACPQAQHSCCTKKTKNEDTDTRFAPRKHSCCAKHTAHSEAGLLQGALTQHALSCSTPAVSVLRPAHSKAEACAHLATAQLSVHQPRLHEGACTLGPRHTHHLYLR